MRRRIIAAGAAIIVAAIGFSAWPTPESNVALTSDTVTASSALANVIVPETLSSNAQIGKVAFEAACVSCHGENAAGQDGVAPPLVHIIYEPNHHGDESFQRAAALGVRAHHWPFGNMPPVEGVTRADVAMIVAYVRELQRANGIN